MKPSNKVQILDISGISAAAGAVLSIHVVLVIFGVPIALTGVSDFFASQALSWWGAFLVFAGAGAGILYLINDYSESYWRAWFFFSILLIAATLIEIGFLLLHGEWIEFVTGVFLAILPLGFLGYISAACLSLLGQHLEVFDRKLTAVMKVSHRLSDNDLRVGSGGLPILGRAVFAVGLLGPLGFLASIFLGSFGDMGDFTTFGPLLLFALPVFGFLIFSGRRLMQPKARADVENLQDLPVVLLRAFADDARQIQKKSDISTILSFGYNTKVRLEQAIANEVWRIGPFYAVGEPGEALPKLGAAKLSLSDNDWQGVVSGWIQRARVIVMIAGRTQWLEWELNQVIRHQAVDRLLILLPPGEPGTRKERWKQVTARFKGSPLLSALRSVDVSQALAVYFGSKGCVTVIECSENDQESYELAIRLAAYGMLDGRE